MRGAHRRSRRLPAGIATALPLEPRERTLGWAMCVQGCRLVATTHGLWEWPLSAPPRRHCWRAIDEVRATPGTLTIRPESPQRPGCDHGFAAASTLPGLVTSMASGARLVDLSFTLPSGSGIDVRARTCRFEGTIVWTSRLHSVPGADAGADAAVARGLLARARQEYGTLSDPKGGPFAA